MVPVEIGIVQRDGLLDRPASGLVIAFHVSRQAMQGLGRRAEPSVTRPLCEIDELFGGPPRDLPIARDVMISK